MFPKQLLSPTLIGALLLVTACGGKESDPGTEASGQTDQAVLGEPVTIDLSGTDQMQFSATALEAFAGHEITVNFTNEGKLPKEAMGHNFVVLYPGTDAGKFGTDCAPPNGTVENNYLPNTVLSRVVAHTKLLGPGEKETVKFTIEEPGTYPYVCSFPGHVAMMKGTLTVK